MKKITPIKIKLIRNIAAHHTLAPTYMIAQITGAITIGCFGGKIVRAGDRIDEKEAEHLTRSYDVSVTAAQ